jgi:hypothetical protein
MLHNAVEKARIGDKEKESGGYQTVKPVLMVWQAWTGNINALCQTSEG